MDASSVLFSIIIPTYERRDIVLSTVSSVVATRRPWPCELIVVVDGSRDGTVEALRGLDLPLPLTVHEQPNQGSAAARNAGAAAARGRYLLFLDDDMTVEADLLVEHGKTLAAGADAVVGHMELDPRSPRNLLTRGIERWAAQRKARLDRSAGRLGVGDFLSGQLSVRAEWFARLGGFDAGLTANGTFGGEDTDLVYRLLQDGARVRANLSAVSHQHYVVSPEQNIRQWTQAGRADTMLARKHPGLGAILTANHGGNTAAGRLLRALAMLPDGVTRAAGEVVVRRVGRGRMDLPTEYLFARFRDSVYWRAVRQNGGLDVSADAGPLILAYHAIADLTDSRNGQYGVPPELFAEHIAALREAGHRFIDADDLLEHLDGRPLPPRSVLLTFDDAYSSVLTDAAPVLDRLGIRGVVCVVGDQIGGYNAWVADHGGARLPLLDAAQLATLRAGGWEIASHSRRHAHLTTLGAGDLRADLRAGRDALTAAGLGTPRIFVYPYGEHDSRLRAHVRRAGFDAALAVTTEHAHPGPHNRYALPRVEAKRDTTPAALLRMMADPARTRPGVRVGRELHALATAVGVTAVLSRSRRKGATGAGVGSPAAWCGEFELSGDLAPTGVVAARDETTMRVLVRLHGEPLGYLSLPRTGTAADVAEIRAAAWREFGAALQAHLAAEGARIPADSERTAWRPAAAPPACPNRVDTDELFSVVVCTRNRSESLPACLDRLAAVDHPAVEFLIVDNAPADASTELLVKSYAAADERFRYLCEPRPGLSRARNAGLAAARGRYIAYTDDDVAVDAGWLRGLARGFQRRADVVCVTGLVGTASIANDSEAYCDARLLSWSTRTSPQLFDMSASRRSDALYPFSAGIFGTGASFAFDRERLVGLGGFDEALGAGTRTRGGEDLDAFVRVLLGGGAIAYEPSAVVWHHHRADEDSLLQQMYGYGTGLTAYLTKLVLHADTRMQVLRRVPAGLARIALIKRQTDERMAASVTAPRGALRREFTGYLAGPWLYAAARRAARRSEART
ncbi:glycosyltransferase [Actinoplanes nipponensis]|uniref:glycosyltransferase n=1 Tax=Actinoplanes nipponensis TaxID=135950 RepID=UPI0019412D7E|nr:glycosyltransferase [Actinoplanes nipponensis]